MKVVIAGTGTMGATFGSLLKMNGNDVDFLDGWSENRDAINKNGIHFINLGKEEYIEAKAYKVSEYNQIPDLIIVFTKSMGLKNMLEDIKHLIGKNTKVMCLLNGLGHLDTLKEYVSVENIIMGVTTMTASMLGPGKFEVTGYGKTEIQDNGDILEELIKTGLVCNYSENIMYSIWRKACINGTMNALSAILEANLHQIGKVENIKNIINKIVKEFSSVAKVEGINIEVDTLSEHIFNFTKDSFAGSRHYPSMYQDLVKNHRYTEVDYLNGYISKKAKKYGIDTPYCDFITIIIHGKESVLGVK